jgi:hypothetical protein
MSSRTSSVQQKRVPSKRELQRQIEMLQQQCTLALAKNKPSVDSIEALPLVETSILLNKAPEDWGQIELDAFNSRKQIVSDFRTKIENFITESIVNGEENIDYKPTLIWLALAQLFGRYHTNLIVAVASDEMSEAPLMNPELISFIKSSIAHLRISPDEYFLHLDFEPLTLEKFKEILK